MNTPDSPPPNPTFVAALYQVTARWYTNDAQLIWRRLTLFVTLNTGLITAQIFASHLHLAIRVALPVLGMMFSIFWYRLLRRMWHYQDFQAAVLRKQELEMGLEQLGAFSVAYTTRAKTEDVTISGMRFSAAKLHGGFRNRHFTLALVPIFLCFHGALLTAATMGRSLLAASAAPSTQSVKEL